MSTIGGFDPGLGVSPLRDGWSEIGRANLPQSTRIIPESPDGRALAAVYGTLADSGLMERFAPYLALELEHRELLAPDVFFETLEAAEQAFRRESEERGQPEEGPLVQAARRLAEILADRDLCDMLRNLVMKA